MLLLGWVEPTEVIMVGGSRPDFGRECGREDSNL